MELILMAFFAFAMSFSMPDEERFGYITDLTTDLPVRTSSIEFLS